MRGPEQSCYNPGAMVRLFALLIVALSGQAQAADAGTRPRIAVLYFETGTTDVELQAFSKGLAALMTTDLSSNEQLDVLERERLEAVLAELKLGESRAAHKGSFAQVGKLLGVDYLVMGLLVGAGGRFALDAHVVKVETSKTVGGARVMLDPKDVFVAEEQLVEKLGALFVKLGSLAVAPAPPAKRTHPLPLKTAVAYSKALDARDKKDPVTATRLLGEVLKEQPDFKLAQLDLLSLTK